MSREDILEKVISLCAETLELDEDELSEKSSFKDLGADSFDLLELVTSMEDEFDMKFDDEVLENINTIGDAVDGLLAASE